MVATGFVTNSSSTSYLVFYDAAREDELRQAIERRAREHGGYREPQHCLLVYDTFEELVAEQGFGFEDWGFLDAVRAFADFLRDSRRRLEMWWADKNPPQNIRRYRRYKVGFVIDPDDYEFGIYDDVLAELQEKGVVLVSGKLDLLWF